MPPTFAIALTIGLVACVTDIRTRRIPNVLTFGGAVLALGYHLATGGGGGLVGAIVGWTAGVAFFFVPFALRGMGGGDVKLMGALGAWLGAATAVWVALYAGIAGGVLALVVAAYRGYLGTALRNLWLLLTHWRVVGARPLHELTLEGNGGPRLAYAVPIFVGILVTTWLHS
jgi:prepilin peptidase CpaA